MGGRERLLSLPIYRIADGTIVQAQTEPALSLRIGQEVSRLPRLEGSTAPQVRPPVAEAAGVGWRDRGDRPGRIRPGIGRCLRRQENWRSEFRRTQRVAEKGRVTSRERGAMQ